MANIWGVVVEGDYVLVESTNEMYPAITWVGEWSWQEDLPNSRSLFYGLVNDQVKSEISTSPNVVLHSSTLQE